MFCLRFIYKFSKVQISFIFLSLCKFSSSWKLQLCIYESTVTILEENCPFGVWFTQPWEISSACVDGGIWAVYKDWCQERPFIWTVYPDKRGCMRPSILKNVLGMVYLGPESSGAALSTKRNKLFLTSEHLKRMELKGNINPETNQITNNDNKPLNKSQLWNVKEPQLDILTWGNEFFSAHEYSAQEEHHKCLLKGLHTYSAGYAFPLKFLQNVRFEINKEPCKSISSKYRRWDNFQLLPQHLDSGIIISPLNENKEFHCVTKNLTLTQHIRSKNFKRNIQQQQNHDFMSYSRSADLLTLGHSEQINEQTERLARKLIAHVFIDEPLPDMDFVEWKFILMAEDIFDIACPHSMVPTEFFENIIILFRFILLESFDKFPPQIENDQGTRLRIEKNLQSCLAASKPMKLKVSTNCSTGSDNVTAEYVHTNGTVEDAVVKIPDRVQINVGCFDVLLESTWKLMIFAHYYCADHFKGNPQDLSTLLQRWQDLMAPDILTRWQFPGKSYEMFRTLIRSVDLSRTLMHVDHCIAASHMFSVYPGWVQRPIPLPVNVNGEEISGNPYGTRSGYAPPAPAAAPAKKGGRGGFNFYTSPMGSRFPESRWDEITHCLPDYTYPAEILGYSYDKCGASKSE